MFKYLRSKDVFMSTVEDCNAEETTKERPDITKVMAEIRERIAADVEAYKDTRPQFEFKEVSGSTGQRKAGELLASEELRYLNQHYALGPTLDLNAITSHRPGIIGKAIVKAKRKFLSLVWDLLKGYFAAEREFNANLVRYLNESSKYIDDRDASNFWELIRKIDVDVTRALERIERINDEQMASVRSTERRVYDALDENLIGLRAAISDLNSQSVQHADKLKTLDAVARGLESIIARAAENKQVVSAQEVPEGTATDTDYSYVLLENRYRGGEDVIKERLNIYPPYFQGVTKPVLEIGGGRGELLELFREQQIPGYCVDVDRAMVEASTAKGLDARLGDGLAHLRSLEDDSLAGVIAVQVVEHLTRQQLEELFKLCRAKVQSGGTVIFETINPRSLLALSSNYFRDMTHVWPLHPDTLEYAMTLHGLTIDAVRFLSPVPEEACLQPIEVQEYMTPRWIQTVDRMNRNFKQLNELIYGYQDYCIVARVS